MLKKNEVNRDVRRGDLESYIRMMTDGSWGVCVEPIVYDTNGNLINGQHRLMAQVASGTSHWWLILHEAPPEAAKTVNAGARARLADILKYNGEKHYVARAGVTNNTYLWAHDLLGQATKAQPTEGELWLDAHQDLRHSTDVAVHAAVASVIDIGPTVLGTAHWIIAQKNNHAEADLFLTRMAYLQNEKPGSPIIALLNRMHKGNIDKHGRPPTRDQIAAVIKVWNFDVEERFTQRIIIGNRNGWENPTALKKDTLITEEELHSMPGLAELAGKIPPKSEIVDEGVETD